MSVRETFMFFGDVFQTIYLLDSLFTAILIQYFGKDFVLLFYFQVTHCTILFYLNTIFIKRYSDTYRSLFYFHFAFCPVQGCDLFLSEHVLYMNKQGGVRQFVTSLI